MECDRGGRQLSRTEKDYIEIIRPGLHVSLAVAAWVADEDLRDS